jgi:hypothetical protein
MNRIKEKVSVFYIESAHDAMSHNVTSVCDVVLRPTGPKGHVVEARAAARRNPSCPLGQRSTLRTVIGCCAIISGCNNNSFLNMKQYINLDALSDFQKIQTYNDAVK